MQIVDLSIFMKTHSVKCADVDFDEIKLVDCRQERRIWCNLHLVRPHKDSKFKVVQFSTKPVVEDQDQDYQEWLMRNLDNST